jgi:hypothetical protein
MGLFGKKKVVAWTSKKCSAKNANKLLAREIEKMAKKGYILQSSNIAQEGRSKRSWLLLGILNFARGKQVVVNAIFVLAPEPMGLEDDKAGEEA